MSSSATTGSVDYLQTKGLLKEHFGPDRLERVRYYRQNYTQNFISERRVGRMESRNESYLELSYSLKLSHIACVLAQCGAMF